MNELKPVPSRSDIDALQMAMADLEQFEDFETLHHFAGGMYCREMRVPAGCTVVGKIHKTEHLFMVIAGEVTIACDGFRERVKAPFIAVSKPGMKRALVMHEDSVCVNVHEVGTCRDLDEIERLLIEDEPISLFDARNQLKRRALR